MDKRQVTINDLENLKSGYSSPDDVFKILINALIQLMLKVDTLEGKHASLDYDINSYMNRMYGAIQNQQQVFNDYRTRRH